MNYKALEDLINILVRKCGTELDAHVAEKEISILENRLRKVRSDISGLKDYISTNDYTFECKKEKDELKKDLLKNEIESLKSKKEEIHNELKDYEKLEEDGLSHIESLVKEKDALEQYANCLNRDRNYYLLEKSGKYDEYNSKYTEVKNNLANEIAQIEKYNLLLEQFKEIETSLKTLLDEYDNFIVVERNHSDNNEKLKDELKLQKLQNEEGMLVNKIEQWKKNPEIIGKDILQQYKNGASIEEVTPLIDELIEKANTEYKKTFIEVKESNIFGTMDKYNKNINYVDSEISKGSYKDLNRQDYLTTIKGYHKDKLKLNKNELENLRKQKEEYLSLINVITILRDEIQKRRIDSERELMSYESRLFDTNMVGINESDMKEFDKLIINIKEEIEENSNLEYEYNNDIANYKERVREIENRITGLEKFITTFEDKVNNIIMNTPRNGFVDNKKLLNDRLLLVEYDNRLKSISNQQQYLYVDSKVIKDEIANLWSIKDDNNLMNNDFASEENYDTYDNAIDNNDDIIVMDEPQEVVETTIDEQQMPVQDEQTPAVENIEEIDLDEDYDIFEDNDNTFMEM